MSKSAGVFRPHRERGDSLGPCQGRAADPGDRLLPRSRAADIFVSAISSLHELSTPYHLAHGLLDHASYLTLLHHGEAAEAATSEARDIAARCAASLSWTGPSI